jgi:hypothetical protein
LEKLFNIPVVFLIPVVEFNKIFLVNEDIKKMSERTYILKL